MAAGRSSARPSSCATPSNALVAATVTLQRRDAHGDPRPEPSLHSTTARPTRRPSRAAPAASPTPPTNRARGRRHLVVHHRGAAAAAARRGPGRPDPRRLLGGQPVQPLLRRDPPQRGPERVQRGRHLDRERDGLLADYDVVVLGEVAIDARQAAMFDRRGSTRGGNLIAMRPDPDLAGLLGLTDAGTDLSDAYLQIDTSAGKPGAGSSARRSSSTGPPTGTRLERGRRTLVATLYSNASTATANPAVTLRERRLERRPGGGVHLRPRPVGRLHAPGQPGLGRAASATASSRRSSAPTTCSTARTGSRLGDLNKVQIPQADEQQRLLANLIEQSTATRCRCRGSGTSRAARRPSSS